MGKSFELKVHLAQDEETGRWFVAESDIPGLWLEADSATDLMLRIEEAAPELIALNEAEILAAYKARDDGRRREVAVKQAKRPSIIPVFDSPVQLACA